MNAPVEWASVWEDDVDNHECIAELLARAFPRSPTPFGGARSWSSARPELRLVGMAEGRAVAHAAVLRRFMQVEGQTQLVGDVGLVAVDPARHGTGLGGELLVRMRAMLAGLDMPFGFLTCGEQVTGFYSRGGWARIEGPTRMVRADGRVQVYAGVSMVLAVTAPLAHWPPGQVDRNGLEV